MLMHENPCLIPISLSAYIEAVKRHPVLRYGAGTYVFNLSIGKSYLLTILPVSILYKSIAGRYRPVRVADGPITARFRFIMNTS